MAVCVAVLVGLSATSSQAAVQAASPLGTKDPAKGAPVKIGFVTDDKNEKTDNSIETPVANATVKWLNDYMGGIGGHPITLDRCVDLAEPGKGTDCANQMIADKVAAVVIGSNAVLENVWTPLQAAGIPVFLYGASNAAVVADPNTTFIFSNGPALMQGFPSAVAKANKSKKVSVVAIDVPAATSYFKNQGPADFEAGPPNGVDPGRGRDGRHDAADARLVSGNPDGIVFVIGNDAFCIAAFNGLRTAAFKGTVTSIPQCLSDATRTAVPGDFLKGMKISATSPLDDPKNPSMKQYAVRVASVRHCGIEVTVPLNPAVRKPLKAAMRNPSFPITKTVPSGLPDTSPAASAASCRPSPQRPEPGPCGGPAGKVGGTVVLEVAGGGRDVNGDGGDLLRLVRLRHRRRKAAAPFRREE